MENRMKTGMALTLSALLVGCANQNFKPAEVLCPLVGAVAGAGILGAATDSDEAGVYVGGAVLGGALGYFLCHERTPPPVAAAPAPAPTPAPAAPPPPPPPPAPAAGTKIMSLEGTNFDFNKSTLRPEAIAKLDHAAEVMQQNAGIKVNVEGHTDSVGSDSYNQQLSQRRAQAVVKYLVGKGIDAGRLMPAGYGESRPAATNDTAEGRAQNRRVDLVVAGE